MSKIINLVLTGFVILLVISSCQMGKSDPSTPGTILREEVGMSDDAGHRLFGYYTVSINIETCDATVIPVRSGMLHVNVTGILNATMGLGVSMVPGESDPANGLFAMDISLTHPFEAKPQLTGFDVKGILLTPGSLVLAPLIFADHDEIRLENADGYTRWWNPTEFTTPGMFGYTQGTLASAPAGVLTAIVNPYKYFADVLYPTSSLAAVADAGLTDPDGRGVFSAGKQNTRRYEIRFPMDPGPQIVFGYAIDASWDVPTPNPPTAVPDDFPIEANQPEPWRVGLTEIVNTLYHDSETGASGGVLRIGASVFDWQGMDSGDLSAEISAVRFYAPDLAADGIDAVLVGGNFKSLAYNGDFTGIAAPAAPGEVVVVCRAGSTDGSTYNQVGDPAPDVPLSAYDVMIVEVSDPECTADANNDFTESFEIDFGTHAIDQLCSPDDYKDFYHFETPPGFEVTGTVQLLCDLPSTKIGIYNSDEELIEEQTASGGGASISFDSLDLPPGDYYIRVYTSDSSFPAPYLLEMTAELLDVSPNITDVTPPGLWMNLTKIWIEGDYAYGFSYGVWVIDISNPSDVQVVSFTRIPGGYSSRPAAFNYPWIYIGQAHYESPEKGEIQAVDVSDPLSPVLYEDVILTNQCITAMCMNSTDLYVGTQPETGNIQIYDYSTDPQNPVLAGDFTNTDEPKFMDLIDPEGSATQLVIAESTELRSYNVEDPLAVTDTGDYGLPPGYYPNDIVVDGNYIYVVDVDALDNGWLDYYIQGFSGISYVKSASMPGQALHVDVQAPYVYVADNVSGIAIVDVSEPLFPININGPDLVHNCVGIAASSDLVIGIQQYSGITVFDRTDPENLVELCRPKVLNSPTTDFYFQDNYLIIGDWSAPPSIDIVDVSDPSQAYVIKENFQPVTIARMAMYGDLIAAGSAVDVVLVDASDIMSMNYSGLYCSCGPELTTLGMKENALYFFYHDSGKVFCRVINVSDPSSPTDGTSFWYDSVSSLYNSVLIDGDFMYIPTSDGVRIYSLSNPFNPDYITTWETSVSVFEIEIQSDFLYIWLSSIDVVEIVDISNPLSPVFVDSGTAGTYSAGDMTVYGQYAYFSGSDPGIYAAQIWPTDEISPAGSWPHWAMGADLFTHDGYLYKYTLGTGLAIFDLY